MERVALRSDGRWKPNTGIKLGWIYRSLSSKILVVSIWNSWSCIRNSPKKNELENVELHLKLWKKMGMIAHLVQVTTSVMVKMLTFLQIGLDLACPMFCVFWIYGSHVASLSFIFFGSCCTQLCIVLVPMKLERFNFCAIQRIVGKEEIKLRKNNRELNRLASSFGICTALRNFIMQWYLT